MTEFHIGQAVRYVPVTTSARHEWAGRTGVVTDFPSLNRVEVLWDTNPGGWPESAHIWAFRENLVDADEAARADLAKVDRVDKVFQDWAVKLEEFCESDTRVPYSYIGFLASFQLALAQAKQ